MHNTPVVAAQHVSDHNTEPIRRLDVYSVGDVGLLKDDKVYVSLGHTAQCQPKDTIASVLDVVQS